MDDTANCDATDDVSLAEFLSRPVRIHEFTWTVAGTNLGLVLNPWKKFLEDTRVYDKFNHYKLLSGKLRVKFMLNGTAFHYGRLLIDYQPLKDDIVANSYDTLTMDGKYVLADFVGATQRPHVMLDPSNNQGAELSLPFMFYKNKFNTVNGDYYFIGRLVYSEIADLGHVNSSGAVTDLTVTTYAWMEDVKLTTPTGMSAYDQAFAFRSATPSSKIPPTYVPLQQELLEPQSGIDEYGKGPISRVAGTVANVASRFTNIPMLRNYAMATQLGATAIGNIATLFGYSAPVDFSFTHVHPKAKKGIAVCNDMDDVDKLTVDAKQELTLDPSTVGLNNVDELNINYIAGRESFLTRCVWADTFASDTCLFSAVVDPGIVVKYTDISNDEENHLPPCSFAALPFRYWRGSLKYRFTVVCSRFHKGRLKICWDPYALPLVGAPYPNTTFTTIVDISDTTDFVVVVGWGASTSYRDVMPGVILSQDDMFTTSGTVSPASPVTYQYSAAPYGNGAIALYVENILTTSSDVAEDIQILVSISAGDDFELAVPSDRYSARMRLTSVDNLDGPTRTPLDPQSLQLLDPQSGYGLPDDSSGQEKPNQSFEAMKTDSDPLGAPEITHMGGKHELSDNTNKVFYGEVIRSMRTLLKRYSRHEKIPVNITGTSGEVIDVYCKRRNMPFVPGYTSEGINAVRPQLLPLTFGRYMHGYLPFVRYISLAYVGWRGSLRYVAEFSDCGQSSADSNWTGKFYVGVDQDDGQNDIRTIETTRDPHSVAGVLDPASLASTYNNSRKMMGHTGTALTIGSVNQLASFEVPFYSNYRFCPARYESVRYGSVTDRIDPMWGAFLTFAPGSQHTEYVDTYVAAGEDFTCFWFIGAPVMFFEPTAPTA
jgi:hypothetical protein